MNLNQRDAWGGDWEELQLMEFELGSRVTSALLAENMPLIGSGYLAGLAPVEPEPESPGIDFFQGDFPMLVGCYVQIEDSAIDPKTEFRVQGVYDDGRWKCEQVFPLLKDTGPWAIPAEMVVSMWDPKEERDVPKIVAAYRKSRQDYLDKKKAY